MYGKLDISLHGNVNNSKLIKNCDPEMQPEIAFPGYYLMDH